MELCVEKKDLLCRTCLCFVIDEDCLNILEDSELYGKYAACTSLQVDPYDEYPKNICSSCCAQLSLFYDFKQMCCDTLGRFKDFLKNSSTEILKDEGVLLLDELKHCESKCNSKNNTLNPEKYQVKDKLKQSNINPDPDIEDNLSKSHKTEVAEEKFTHEFEDSKYCVNNQTKLTDNIKLITACGQVENGKILNEVHGLDDKNFSKTNKHRELKILTVKFINETTIVEKSSSTNDETIFRAENDKECAECVTSTQDDDKYLLQPTNSNINLNNDNHRHCDSSTTEPQEDEIIKIDNTSGQIQKAIGLKNTQISKRVFFCKLCPKKFRKEERFQAHLRTHKGLKAYACTQCDKQFARIFTLHTHIERYHSGTHVSHSCPYEGCTRAYNRKESLSKHINECHSKATPAKIHMCEVCGKVFNRKMFLNRHRFVHIDKSLLPFECNECGKRFSKKLNLNYHLNRHAGIKNFICALCGMQKTTKSELKAHMNYHTLEKRWTCQACGKIFNTLGNLKLHMRTVHQGVRDYKCSYCNRQFGKAGTLRCHEMRHTGERPHQCKLCGHGFIQAVALRSHMKVHAKMNEKIY